MGDNREVKKVKETKACIIKQELMFENYKNCLFNCEVISKSQQKFKSNHPKVYTKEVNKMALSSDDDKGLQIFDGKETYPYGTNAFKVFESKMMSVRGLFVENYTDFLFYGKIVLKQ